MPYTDIGGFNSFISGGSLTLAVCLRIERKDGLVLGFTNHIQDITLPSITVGSITIPETTYTVDPGCIPTDLSESDTLSADNMEVTGAISGPVTYADLQGNLYRDADWTLILCNYADTSMQQLRKRGRVASVKTNGPTFTFSLESLTAAFRGSIIDLAGPLCRYRVLGSDGGDNCPFNMNSMPQDGYPARIYAQITAQPEKNELTIDDTVYWSVGDFIPSGSIGDIPLGRFAGGLVRIYLDGSLLVDPLYPSSTATAPYTALSFDILDQPDANTLRLRWAPGVTLHFENYASGKIACIIDMACDRKITTCSQTFNVAYGFGGEPGMPTIEQTSAQYS